MSFETATFPEALKIGKFVPIYKKNDKICPENYRPVTILNTISKIFERAYFERLMLFLDKYKILFEGQNAFRKGRSTEGAACDFMSLVYDCLDGGNCVAGLFFDLSRAFDSLQIDFLLKKLSENGVRGAHWVVWGFYLDKTHYPAITKNHVQSIKKDLNIRNINSARVKNCLKIAYRQKMQVIR